MGRPRLGPLRSGLGLLLLAATASAASAADSLRLADALTRALQKGVAAQIARLEAERAGHAAGEVRANYLPQVGLTSEAGWSNRYNETFYGADANGNLVTSSGDAVLGRNNQPLRVGADGKVDPRTLNVVLLANPEKAGNNLVTGTPAAGAAGAVRSGALEGSGANPTQSMVDMIASMRAYEAGQKVIRTGPRMR